MRILFIEDENRLRDALCRGFREEGHEVVAASTGSDGLRIAEAEVFDVIVCDILLPHVNGFQICQRLRDKEIWTPILMLTAKDGEWDQDEALEAGADDYLTKPFSYVVLRAHIRALARRGAKSPKNDASLLEAGDLVLDFRRRRCARGGTEIELSRREFELLAVLLAAHGEAVSKNDLITGIWGPDLGRDPNIVEVYIGYLRKKIDAPFNRHTLETVRGYGYRLNADAEPK
jgi:two-component system, OmpR family, response regulator